MQFNETYSATADSAGSARIDVRPPRMQRWTVAQVSIEMPDAPVGSVCELRKNGALITPLIATGDVASGEPYVQLLSTDVLSVVWSSVNSGNTGKALVFYTEA